MSSEIWKDIPGYEGIYQVSDLGRVKSFKNKNKILMLKCRKNGRGYLGVVLCNINAKPFLTHKLVAMAFLGHKPDGTHKVVVDHIDNNKMNNRLNNLQLISQRENASKDKISNNKYRGVHFSLRDKKWQSGIKFNGRKINLGSYDNEIDALNAYQKAINELNQGLDLNTIYPIGRHKTSKYRGVSFDNNTKKWTSTHKSIYLGRYNTEIEAFNAIQEYIN